MEKSDFQNYRALRREVRDLKNRLAGLEQELDAVNSPQYSVTPKGPASGGSSLAARVIRFCDVEAFYKTELARRNEQLLRVEQAIVSLEVAAERLVMRMRYVDGRSWTSICTELMGLGYSERQVYRLHGSALLKLKGV